VQETPHNNNALSLAQGTLIACEDGDIAVENLKAGDIVNTLSDGPQVIRWVGATPANSAEIIHLAPGALGPNSPATPLLVAPHHRLILSNWRAELLFDSQRVMIQAKSLVNGTSITRISPEPPLALYHILFDNHEIISANNAPCESFLPQVSALKTLPATTRDSIKAQLTNPPEPLTLPTITAAEAALLT